MREGRKGITGSTLKWIAIITMLIDHIGATVLTKQLIHNWSIAGQAGLISVDGLYVVMYITRQIGRIAFPVFCFLLVEGFQRTKDIQKYIYRMLLFAIISEIPFNLALTGEFCYPDSQNVMLTMLIGLLTMQGCYMLEQHVENKIIGYIGCALCCGAGVIVAEVLKTDYAAKGIIAIMVLYFLRRNRLWQMLGGCVSFIWEPAALLAFPVIWFYNGERGMKMKWFFYAFYPLHLFILYLICVILGLGSISVL